MQVYACTGGARLKGNCGQIFFLFCSAISDCYGSISTPQKISAPEVKLPWNYGHLKTILYYTSCCGRGLVMTYFEEQMRVVRPW
jgi:hypothetical protein